MNVEMLKKVRDAIAESGDEHFNMDDWASTVDGKSYLALQYENDGTVAFCRTAMCIAGWTVYLDDKAKFSGALLGGRLSYIALRAEEILDINYNMAIRLFHKTRWPQEYQSIAILSGQKVAALKLLDDLIEFGFEKVFYGE